MPTFGIAPLVLHVPLLKHSVEESLHSICHGCQVKILPGSACQGLCNHDFPVHCVATRHTNDNDDDDDDDLRQWGISFEEALFARSPINPKSSSKLLSNSVFGNQKGQFLVFRGAVEVLSLQMSVSLWALMTCETSIFFVSFPQPIMPKFFASGRIPSLAFSSAQGLSNVPKLKSALEQSRAGAGGEETSLSEQVSRSGGFAVVAVDVVVVVGGRKVAVDAGGKVAVDAGGGRKVAVAVAVAVEFVATALMTSSVG